MERARGAGSRSSGQLLASSREKKRRGLKVHGGRDVETDDMVTEHHHTDYVGVVDGEEAHNICYEDCKSCVAWCYASNHLCTSQRTVALLHGRVVCVTAIRFEGRSRDSRCELPRIEYRLYLVPRVRYD